VAFCLTVPATAGLIILAEPLIRLIFEHGRFNHFSTLKTAGALVYYAIGLAAYAAVKVTVPVFYNIDNTRVPVAGSFLAVIVNVAVILLTIDHLQHRALALSISCAMSANFLFLFVMLYLRLEDLPLNYLGSALGKVLAATAVMTGWLLAWQRLAGSRGGLVWEALRLLVEVGSGALIYGLGLYWLRLPEISLIVERFRQKLRGRQRA
jgi:putative peptidoglycan lipid II flippase